MRIEDALVRSGGVATFGELVSFGVLPSDIAEAVEQRRVEKPYRGVYARNSAVDLRAATRRFGGALSHTTAALWWGIPAYNPDRTCHLTVPRRRNPQGRGDVIITRADIPTTLHRGVPVTTPLQTVLDCLRTLSTRQAVVIADAALRQERFTRDELAKAVEAIRGDRNAPRARSAFAMVDARSESVLESLCRVTLMEAGIAPPDLQTRIETPSGAVRVDFCWPEQRVVLEAEGFLTHGQRDALARDCVRGNGIVLAGYTLLRVAWEHVTVAPSYVVGIVAAALTAARKSTLNSVATS